MSSRSVAHAVLLVQVVECQILVSHKRYSRGLLQLVVTRRGIFQLLSICFEPFVLQTFAEIRRLVYVLLLTLLVVGLLVKCKLLLVLNFVSNDFHVQMRYLAVLFWRLCRFFHVIALAKIFSFQQTLDPCLFLQFRISTDIRWRHFLGRIYLIFSVF